MSLERLIKLARYTGDRLIVHQPNEGHDVVIMDVDEYESLLDKYRDVRTMSVRQLIDKINRDIAIWRANDKFEGGYDDDDEETEVEGGEDNWESAGSILDNKFVYPEEDFLARELNEESDELNEKIEGDTNKSEPEKEETKAVPWVESADKTNEWQEEALPEEEPVFYEEPV